MDGVKSTVSKSTVVDWSMFCREVCMKESEMLGSSVIVEIDESKFGERKYNRLPRKGKDYFVLKDFSGAYKTRASPRGVQEVVLRMRERSANAYAMDLPESATNFGVCIDPHGSRNPKWRQYVTIQIYNPLDNKVRSSISRFEQSPYGGVFRNDGQLLVAGSEDGVLRLFDTDSNQPRGIFKGHTAATHRCNFFNDRVNIVSFSDDKSVRVWDIPTETHILTYQEHKDYIRAGTICRYMQEVILSGSYDHTVKMYDTRTDKCVKTVDHGSPVESVIMFPSGGLYLSAGGNEVKVWDSGSGRLYGRLLHHHKTVTSLCFASDRRRVMSGSLDRHVKIYDTSSYRVVHTLRYPSPILSVASAPGDKVVAVGMADGLISIRHKSPEEILEQEKKENEEKWKYQQSLHMSCNCNPAVFYGDIRIHEVKSKKYKICDRYLHTSQWSYALDVGLEDCVQNNEPEVTLYVIKELIRRGSLKVAIAGRQGESLERLVKFVIRYLDDIRFIRVLCEVGPMIVEIYSPKLGDPAIKKMMEDLVHAFKEEVKHQEDDIGRLELTNCIIAAASLNFKNESPPTDPQTAKNEEILLEIYDSLNKS